MTETENLVLTMAFIIQSLKILEKAQNNINRENNKLEEQTVSYKKTKDLLEKSLEETIRLLKNTTESSDSIIGDEMCFFCKYYTKMFTYNQGVCDCYESQFWHHSVKGIFTCNCFNKNK